ncbi:hypothetical protein [Schleiferia thermophila]|jgi:hypothetical protein|uniref:Uncharacterized protein n=1 Tax=Schleiferia thermophila TaxID=884107 RepID=A0A369AB82_9FLAO|nr:hypothetical protein [Schleiferia thermophila]KFD40073.1 hypothetical protein AT05_01675 [Schleiferia thermophila str. Yellowstone]RCX05556.1 hypothetical protein DES35_101843 [Schleiferia thermophila]GCD78950.1 hypothetical protein JCM30197_01970 [Schleiferia thermophila]
MKNNFQPIEKEVIKNLKFPKNDVLSDELEKKFRKIELERALRLGNGEKVKFNIYFEDERAKLKVHTTIWGLTEDQVILKTGVTIPISRIHLLD